MLASVVLVVSTVVFFASAAGADWLIDPAKYHASAHGQIPCLDCHGDKAGDPLHPDPENVNRELREFFEPDDCLGCHEEVATDMEKGDHGGPDTVEVEDAYFCIACHDPHRQARVADPPEGFDPSARITSQCGVCHQLKEKLPEPPADEIDCRICHETVESPTAGGEAGQNPICLHCHRLSKKGKNVAKQDGIPRFDTSNPEVFSHGFLSCMQCHKRSARYPHDDQAVEECEACHVRHDERKANAAHLSVSCAACHLQGGRPVKDAGSGEIRRERQVFSNGAVLAHSLTDFKNREACRSCHRKGNPIGASAMVLPAKSVLCLPCHPATLTAGDTISLLAIVVFGFGLAGWAWFWFSTKKDGAVIGERAGEGASAGIGTYAKVFFLDILGQRRLWRRSRTRWVAHSLIFHSILFRFAWSASALTLSIYRPESDFTWFLFDKNHPAAAFLFDLTGIMILAGTVLFSMRRIKSRKSEPEGLPPVDWIALSLMCGMVVSGFAAEGARMAMTGQAIGPPYAFAGHVIASLFAGSAGTTSVFGWLWYAHALFVGAFVAYLPFGRLFHIITAPATLLLEAGKGD